MLIQNPALLYKNVYELCKQTSMPGQSWRAFNCAKDKYIRGCNKLKTLVKDALQILYMSNTFVRVTAANNLLILTGGCNKYAH